MCENDLAARGSFVKLPDRKHPVPIATSGDYPFDDQENSPAVAGMGYRAWQNLYGEDPSIVADCADAVLQLFWTISVGRSSENLTLQQTAAF